MERHAYLMAIKYNRLREPQGPRAGGKKGRGGAKGRKGKGRRDKTKGGDQYVTGTQKRKNWFWKKREKLDLGK